LPGFGERLLGLSADARAAITITLPHDIERRDLAGTEKTFEIEIKELRTHQPAAIDDELAKKGGWENLDEMRGWLRQQHETELKSHTRLRLKRALLDSLAGLYAFNVPKGLLEREYQALVRQLTEAELPSGEGAEESHAAADGEHVHDEHCGHEQAHHHEHTPTSGEAALPEEKRQEYRALAERRVRLGLVLAEIGRVNNLRVTQEELGKAMIAQARRFPGQEQAVLEFLRKNPQAQESLAAPILEDKVIDFILEMAQVSERTVPVEELLRDVGAETTSSPDEDQVRS
jgi:trigger factor